MDKSKIAERIRSSPRRPELEAALEMLYGTRDIDKIDAASLETFAAAVIPALRKSAAMDNKTAPAALEQYRAGLIAKIRTLTEAECAEVQRDINSFIEKLNKSRISKPKT